MEVLFGEEKMVISWSSFVQAATLDPTYSIASHTPCIANTINLHLASLEVGGGSLPILDKRSANMHYVCLISLQITNGMSSFFLSSFGNELELNVIRSHTTKKETTQIYF